MVWLKQNATPACAANAASRVVNRWQSGLVLGQVQRTCEFVHGPGQRRFHAHDACAVQQFKGHPVLAQDGDILGCIFDLLLGAEQLRGAQLAAFVLDPGLRAQRIDAAVAVFGQADHARLVDGISRTGAVVQHLRQPQVLGGIGLGADAQRRMLLQQPFDGFQWHPGRGPRRGIAEGQLPGVGETGFQPRTGLAFEHTDLMPGLAQIPGTGDTDHAAAKNQDFHGGGLC